MASSTRTGGRDATRGVIPGRVALSVGRPDLPEPPGFRWTLLTDVARLESGHTPSRRHSDYWGGDIPWIGIRDATGNHGRVIHQTIDHVTETGLNNSSARLLPTGTVCLSRTASVGFTVVMGRPMATSQDFVNWVCGPELSATYLRYILMLEQESIRRFAHGTTHQTMYYPEAKALNVLIPNRQVQDSVAAVLGALDDRMAANDRRAKTALKLARAMFRPTAQDTRRVTLGSLADSGALVLSDGYRTKKAEHGSPGFRILRVGDVRDDRIYPVGVDFVSTSFGRQIGSKLSRPGDVLMTTKGTVGRIAVVPAEMEVMVYSPQLCYFRVEDDGCVDPSYLAAWFRSNDLQHQTSIRMYNSDMAPYINLRDIRSLEMPLPPIDWQRRSGEIQRHLQGAFDAANAESERLAITRSELSPLLMSGKVRVKDAEKFVEGVLR